MSSKKLKKCPKCKTKWPINNIYQLPKIECLECRENFQKNCNHNKSYYVFEYFNFKDDKIYCTHCNLEISFLEFIKSMREEIWRLSDRLDSIRIDYD